VHQRDGVDAAVAAGEGGAEAGPVEQVHMQHREALYGACMLPVFFPFFIRLLGWVSI
jgi:hypothetical protein